MKTTTDQPKGRISAEKQARIDAGRLDFRRDIGWHDPRGYDPEASRRVEAALSLSRRR